MVDDDRKRPLSAEDSLEQTLGCRISNPNCCKNHSTENVCAFVRDDNLCKAPPGSWPKLYKELLEDS